MAFFILQPFISYQRGLEAMSLLAISEFCRSKSQWAAGGLNALGFMSWGSFEASFDKFFFL